GLNRLRYFNPVAALRLRKICSTNNVLEDAAVPFDRADRPDVVIIAGHQNAAYAPALHQSAEQLDHRTERTHPVRAHSPHVSGLRRVTTETWRSRRVSDASRQKHGEAAGFAMRHDRNVAKPPGLRCVMTQEVLRGRFTSCRPGTSRGARPDRPPRPSGRPY